MVMRTLQCSGIIMAMYSANEGWHFATPSLIGLSLYPEWPLHVITMTTYIVTYPVICTRWHPLHANKVRVFLTVYYVIHWIQRYWFMELDLWREMDKHIINSRRGSTNSIIWQVAAKEASTPVGCFSMKVFFYKDWKSRYGDKTIKTWSYLHHGISYTVRWVPL